ncbi:hypothetical protein [Hoeflea prorocentri]|uniref:Uncharacterized protein n=1 Tax=Hoeflea prorocentri TaxID=1922333 RepID=A0A9X3UI20_9HYPH|nr:hypothetical protein [Hoeflea prorocentri]MCY6380996.1 hypothetical protein [Hoeflea prorocentri]MDA5398796.1 hypothetical protein [Hoeflea prorocentri]
MTRSKLAKSGLASRRPINIAKRPGEQPASAESPIIRDAIIQAAVEAGGGDMVAYLKKQAETHPSAFLTLLGKVLPMQLTGGKGEPVNLEFSVRFIAAEQEISGENRRT